MISGKVTVGWTSVDHQWLRSWQRRILRVQVAKHLNLPQNTKAIKRAQQCLHKETNCPPSIVTTFIQKNSFLCIYLCLVCNLRNKAKKKSLGKSKTDFYFFWKGNVFIGSYVFGCVAESKPEGLRLRQHQHHVENETK